MQPSQRLGSSPKSQLDYRVPQPQPANRPGVGPVQPQPQEPAAPEPQDVPFPGLVVHVTFPLINAHEDYPLDTAVPDQHRETTANCATSSTLDVSSDKNPHKLPPLISAVTNGQLSEVFGLLAKAEMDIDQVCEERGWSALMYAANEGQFDLVAALLDAGADVNFSDIKNGETALMLACARDHVKVVQLLLKLTKILIDKPNPKGKTALMIAAWTNKPDILRLLLDARAEVNLFITATGDSALSLASAEGHVEVVKLLLGQQGILLQVAGSRHDNALMLAAKNGHVEIVELLLQLKDIDLNDIGNGKSALMLAAENNKLDVVVRLIDAMTKHHRPVLYGSDALMLASMNGHFQMVDLLLNKGVDPNETSGGNSALLVAAEYGQSDIVGRLIASGADVNLSRGDLRDTALMLASEAGWLKVVELLIAQRNIELDKTDKGGKSALVRAASFNHPAVVACLLDARASTGRVGRVRNNALRHMLDAGYAAIVEVLLEKGVKIDDGAVDFFPVVPTPFATAVADLCAEQAPVAFVLPKPEKAENFFTELIAKLREDPTSRSMLKWLRQKGMRMACAQQLAAALGGAHLLRSVQGASEQQQMNYCLSALSKLGILSGRGKVLAHYRQAKMSSDAIKRLGEVAITQLNALAKLANKKLAGIGTGMVNALVEHCIAQTDRNYEIDVPVLKASLLAQGYCAPIAHAVAVSWQAAISTLSKRPEPNHDHRTIKQAIEEIKAYVAEHVPVLFVQELLPQLHSRDQLAQSYSMLGDTDDVALHAQFQIQCDWLLQYCEQKTRDFLASTSNAASTSNTTSTASTSSPPKQ
jgi:ankyrin repeat protein